MRIHWRWLICSILGAYIATFLILNIPPDHPYPHIVVAVALFVGAWTFIVSLRIAGSIATAWRQMRAVRRYRRQWRDFPLTTKENHDRHNR